jgi:hypothetical protein
MRRRSLCATAIALCLTAAACKKAPPPPPPTDSGPPPAPVWQTVCSGLDDYVLSVWGPAPDDVFFVGGNGVAGRALLLHYNGATWVRTLGVSSEVLWWVAGTSGQDVWAVGENGEALHYDGGFWEPRPTGTTATLYGVWGTAPDAVWAVGGSIDPLGPKDVFLFWDGTSWVPYAPAVPSGETLFKVWGAAADDVWAVGTGGVIFHWDGTVWTRATSPTDKTLITVYGGASNDVWAIGGVSGGLVLHWDGNDWVVAGEGFSPSGLNAVWTEAGSSPIIAGHDGYAARFRNFVAEPLPTGIDEGLHAVFGDGFGMWAAGGALLDLSGGPQGVILRFGTPAAKCDIVDYMQPPIPGTDAGADAGSDPCPGGTASVGPGGECGSGRDCQCIPGLECWWVSICWGGGPPCPPTGNMFSHFMCTAPCASAAACGDYGPGACCIIPGKQTTTTVCHPADWIFPDGDRCF